MPQAATKPRPAHYDAANQDRRVLIAKIHVAKKEMALVDDDYRQMLFDVTGRTSSADCTVDELRQMVEAMKRKGFQPKKAPRDITRKAYAKPADHPFAGKARALWISLYHLNAIDNPSEQALEAFARRQLGCAKMQWANQREAYKLVEALKAIANRNGWNQRTDFVGGIRKTMSGDAALRVLKARLVERIANLLAERRVVPMDWALGRIAFELAGMERDRPVLMWDLGDLDLLAKELGEKLRAATGGQPGGLAPREQGR